MKKRNIIWGLSLAMIVSCSNETFTLPAPSAQEPINTATATIYDNNAPTKQQTVIEQDGEYRMTIKLAKNVTQETQAVLDPASKLEETIKKYTDFRGLLKGEFKLLPETNYEFTATPFAAGSKSTDAIFKMKDYEQLTPGNYILPLQLSVNGEEMLHIMQVSKSSPCTPLSDADPKPILYGRTAPIKTVAYVETNDWDIRNMGEIVLKKTRKPLFDFVIIFAANMNYDAINGRRYLSFNDKLQPLVKNPDIYVNYLKKKGIKVLACILPNHQGVGFANFQSYEEALDYARECKQWAEKLGLDGFDIDEEYADYSKLPSHPIKDRTQSFLWFMRAMKEVMPDKLLTLYDYGHYIERGQIDEQGKAAKDYIDYSWANYGENHGSYIGLPNEKYGKRSVEAGLYGLSGAPWAAQANVRDGFGLFMVFNISGYNVKVIDKTGLRGAAVHLYGDECEWTGIYHKGPKDF